MSQILSEDYAPLYICELFFFRTPHTALVSNLLEFGIKGKVSYIQYDNISYDYSVNYCTSYTLQYT